MNAKKCRGFQLNVEGLEERSLLAAALTATLFPDGLRIEGTEQNDQIIVRRINDWISVDGAAIAVNGMNYNAVPASLAKLVYVQAGGGNDMIRLNSEAVAGQQPLSVPAAVFAGAGDDFVYGTASFDLIAGQDGNDVLRGMGSSDLIWGDAGTDIINGGEGDDFLFGGSGGDSLYGDYGNDLLDGGSEYDYLFGQAGWDRYYDDVGGAYVFLDPYQDVANYGHVSSADQYQLSMMFWYAALPPAPVPFPVSSPSPQPLGDPVPFPVASLSSTTLNSPVPFPVASSVPTTASTEYQAFTDLVNSRVSNIIGPIYGDLTAATLNNDFGNMVASALFQAKKDGSSLFG